MKSARSYFRFSEEDELIKNLKNGNREAFDEIYQRSWKLAFNVIYDIVKDMEITEGILTNVFIALWENRSKLNHYSINPNLNEGLQYEFLKILELGDDEYKVETLTDLAHSLLQPEQINKDQDLKECVEMWIAEGPGINMDIFQLRFYDNRTAEEISTILDLPIAKVQNELVIIYIEFKAYLKG